MICRTPQEAYRRVDFDARVHGASNAELVHVCYDQLVSALGTAIHAAATGDNQLKSRSLTRALTAITALHMGVSEGGGVSQSLRQLYDAARRSILDCAIDFDSPVIERIRSDFIEIGGALRAA